MKPLEALRHQPQPRGQGFVQGRFCINTPRPLAHVHQPQHTLVLDAPRHRHDPGSKLFIETFGSRPMRPQVEAERCYDLAARP